MSLNHPNAISAAFDTIHEEMRRLARVNNEVCKQRDQALAALALKTEQYDDLARQFNQLRGQSSRQAAAPDLALLRATGAV